MSILDWLSYIIGFFHWHWQITTMKSLLKTSFLTGTATFVKIVTGLVTIKIIALYLGPSGVAKLGQFTNLINILAIIAGGGISLGVIKYVAEYAYESEKTLKAFISSSVVYTVTFSLITSALAIIFQKSLSEWIIGSQNYAYLIVITAFSQFFSALNLLLLAILNGYKQIGRMTWINILSSLLCVCVISFMTMIYGFRGALLALILTQALVLLINISLTYHQKWFKFLLHFNVSWQYIKNLSHYSLMSIISTLTVPVAQIIVRYDLSRLFTWHAVGYWQAVIRISDSYLTFATLALTAYYLPRLSELKNTQDIKKEMWTAYKVIMPIVLVSLCFIYFLRDFIIYALYSKAFLPARNLFLFQLVGDFFRIGGWLFTYLLLAKAWTKTYIATEIVLSLLFVVLSHIIARTYGLIGVTYSFTITYAIYWAIMAAIGFYFFKKDSELCQIKPHL